MSKLSQDTWEELARRTLPPVRVSLPDPNAISPGERFSASVVKNVCKHRVLAKQAVTINMKGGKALELGGYALSNDDARGITLTDSEPGDHAWVVDSGPAVADTEDKR